MIAGKKGSVFTLIGLYILTIPFFNGLNVTTYDNSQILGHFGASTTVFTYSVYIPIFSMLAFMPLGLKLGKQIRVRTMILSVSFLSLLFNTASLFAPTIGWFTLCRALMAIVSVIGIFASMVPILLKYNPVFNMALLYGILQFIQKGSQHLYQYIGAHFTSLHNWTFSVYFLNVNFLVCILLAWYFYKADVAPMKAVFQFDWRGWIIMILFLMVILFLCAEGQTRNWFDDPKVGLAAALLFLIFGVYLLHTRFTENPIIDPDVYRYKNVVIGAFLMFYIGIMNGTGSVVTGYMTNILGFDSVLGAQTHLALLLGLCISIPLSTYLLYKRIYLATIWIIGFACYGLYHVMLYLRFYPGIDSSDFFLPLIFKGLGMGFLFPVSLLYISEGVPPKLSTSRMMSGIIAQAVFASLLGGAILGTFISNMNIQHKTGLSQQLTATNKQAENQLASSKRNFVFMGLSDAEAQKKAEKSLSNQTAQTAMLLAYKDIYLVMSAICFLPIFIILLFKLWRRPIGKVEAEPIPI
ncbi:efflux MFS transporter permease [Flavobacterium saccharophilum]|uniref:MFS transporter, DHA2 family, multidrug resistance protein n=1 Tax=Flavobacterium saccharophilum TaxID=29534 RepID=A0A1M7DC00_9FLAO|nr:MFS transporter [Flavobacterium saccharophilum]SHL77051.1 MFS transporter, DHA2 family, multidrug resistance protein [Flavobacterium saccharophilum]